MEHMDEQAISRLNELLRRTGEFIAYFELVESKMMEWREDIETKASDQHRKLQTLQAELGQLQEMLTHAGLAKFRKTADDAMTQGKEYLNAMQESERNVVMLLNDYKQQLIKLCEEAAENITHHSTKSLERLDSQLADYDAQHFFRIANESCEQIERSANNAILKSNKLLRMFHWRTMGLAFFTSLLTAFIIGLYANDEFPWEIHQQAMNERNAGKMLMNVWPKLSHQEKNKILSEQDAKKV